MSKSAMTPSFIGRIASMLPGTLPSMALASLPTAWMVFLPLGPPSWRIATTDGSAFAPGKTVRIDATVWAWSTPSADRLDLYYAADASSPSWTFSRRRARRCVETT